MGITAGGYGALVLGIMGIWIIYCFLYYDMGIIKNKKLVKIIALILTFVFWFGVLFYYNHTAPGLRAYKTQKSELVIGIERTVKVYDVNGNLIQQYDGKFDNIVYDNNRTMFDDEDGKRHIIYYLTGTVIIDEK